MVKNTDLGLDKSYIKAGKCPKCKCATLWRSDDLNLFKCVNCQYCDYIEDTGEDRALEAMERGIAMCENMFEPDAEGRGNYE